MPTTKNTPDPTTKSSDYVAMLPYWQMVGDMIRGTAAMRAAGDKYLPKFESESQTAYNTRVSTARFTNIYADIIGTIAAKPFGKELGIENGSPTIDKLIEDIDGQGNNLHTFASHYFYHSINDGIDWIYVDYTRTSPDTVDASGKPRRKTLAEERTSGARPYWIRVPAVEMIAVYSAVIDGKEEFVHARMYEEFKERDEYDEVSTKQVRELNRDPIYNADGQVTGYGPAYFTILQEKEQTETSAGVVNGAVNKKTVWTVVDQGPIFIGVIPIVPLVIGERLGNTWQITPAMKDSAWLQLEYYEQENGLKNIKTLTAFPMLSASGVNPEIGADSKPVKVSVGPRSVLYAPMSDQGHSGEWKYLEPAGSSLTFLAGDLKELAKELRELGRQPLTANSGNLTVVTTAFAAQKGNSAIQSWGLALKDALEQALKLTVMWLKEAIEPTILIDLDFELLDAESDGYDHVLSMRDKGLLSEKTTRLEAKRRKILSDEFDEDQELKLLEEEGPSDEDLEAAGMKRDPITGLPVPLEEDELKSPVDDPEDVDEE